MNDSKAQNGDADQAESPPKSPLLQFSKEPDRERGYLPIENYGLIGNMRTAALVGTDGSIDFFCFPRLDSPSIFARLLDQHKGGHFHIAPVDDSKRKQQYLPSSNCLQTRFLSEQGVVNVTDFMPLPSKNKAKTHAVLPWLVRQVEGIRGHMRMRVECFPAFNYARAAHTLDLDEYPTQDGTHKKFQPQTPRAVFRETPPAAPLPSPFGGPAEAPLEMELRYTIRVADDAGDAPAPDIQWTPQERPAAGLRGPGVVAEFSLREGQRVTFVFRECPQTARDHYGDRALSQAVCALGGGDAGHSDPPLTASLVDSLLGSTLSFWHAWIAQSTYKGRWRELVHRSALTLKLLTYAPTGAVVASPTFGLPELVGGGRNWDYRYTWIRDSAFTMYAFIRIGLTEEAEDYMRFIELRCQELNPDGSLQIMYTIEGKHQMEELELSHLEGYKASRPVRIGNGASSHLQLDIYGALLDACYLYNRHRSPLGFDMWVSLRKLVDFVVKNWDKPDMSIWEVRGKRQHFVFSKIMCWVALDRGIRFLEKRSLPCLDRAKWYETRDLIYEDIMANGWNPDTQCFTMAYETRDDSILDASVLIMPLVLFMSPADPRLTSTLRKMLLPPERGGLFENSLVYRYSHSSAGFQDGLAGDEGTFTMCTFWMVEALTRAGAYDAGFLAKALYIFETMLGYGNHCFLFSEEIAKSGESLGNFPQAFSHIALISAAFNLDKALSGA